MILIEGSGLVGKTHLAKKLCEVSAENNSPYTYDHLGLLPADWDYVTSYVDRMDPMRIWDRFYLSEIIYGKIIRNQTKTAAPMLGALELMCDMIGTTHIILTATDSVLRSRWETKHRNELFSLDQILAVNHLFSDEGRTALQYNGRPRYLRWVSTDPKTYAAEDAAFIEFVLHADNVARAKALEYKTEVVRGLSYLRR